MFLWKWVIGWKTKRGQAIYAHGCTLLHTVRTYGDVLIITEESTFFICRNSVERLLELLASPITTATVWDHLHSMTGQTMKTLKIT